MGNDPSKDGYNRAPAEEWEGWADDDTPPMTQQPTSQAGLAQMLGFGGGKDQAAPAKKPANPKKASSTKDAGGGALASIKENLTKAGQKIGVVEKKKTITDEMVRMKIACCLPLSFSGPLLLATHQLLPLRQCEMCPKLTMKQRIAGFCAFTGLGYMVAILGTLTLSQGYSEENIQKFAQLYIGGNLIAIAASACFKGPMKLGKAMAHKKRRIGTAVWFGLMITIFVLAMQRAPLPVIVTLLILETMAGVWYAASYIPWGRKVIIGCCQASLFSPCPETLAPIAKQV